VDDGQHVRRGATRRSGQVRAERHVLDADARRGQRGTEPEQRDEAEGDQQLLAKVRRLERPHEGRQHAQSSVRLIGQSTYLTRHAIFLLPRSIVPLAAGPLLRSCLPSSLVASSSPLGWVRGGNGVQTGPRPLGSRGIRKVW